MREAEAALAASAPARYIVEKRAPDILRGKDRETVTLRLDLGDTATLQAAWGNVITKFGPLVALVRDVEVKEQGGWRPYPSVSLILRPSITRAAPYTASIVVLPHGRLSIEVSPGGLPDTTLIASAEREGIRTSRIA